VVTLDTDRREAADTSAIGLSHAFWIYIYTVFELKHSSLPRFNFNNLYLKKQLIKCDSFQKYP
jgi:hypothetical protein